MKAPPACARRWPPPGAPQLTPQTEPIGQKPLPLPQSCATLEPSAGMVLGQPRVLAGVSGHAREAVLIVLVMSAARSWLLHTFLNGVRTLAHSWSHEVGRPLAQAEEAFVQQAVLTSASHAWNEASSVQRSGRPAAWSWRPPAVARAAHRVNQERGH